MPCGCRGRDCDLDRGHGPLLQISRFYQVPEYCEIGCASEVSPAATRKCPQRVSRRVVQERSKAEQPNPVPLRCARREVIS